MFRKSTRDPLTLGLIPLPSHYWSLLLLLVLLLLSLLWLVLLLRLLLAWIISVQEVDALPPDPRNATFAKSLLETTPTPSAGATSIAIVASATDRSRKLNTPTAGQSSEYPKLYTGVQLQYRSLSGPRLVLLLLLSPCKLHFCIFSDMKI